MILAIAVLYGWAGISVWSVKQKDVHGGGKLILLGLSLLFWPLAPLLSIAES